ADALKGVAHSVWIARRRDGAHRLRRGLNATQQPDDRRIRRRRLSAPRGERKQVDPLRAVLEDAGLRERIEDATDVGRRRRPAKLFFVDEEEHLVLYDGPAFADAELLQLDLILVQAVDDVEVVVRVQIPVTEVFVRAAIELVGAGAGDPFDRHRALAGAVGAGDGARHGHFFDLIQF